MSLGIVILAAGQGTRMKSSRPKVLHDLAGRPLLGHVIDTARGLRPEQIVVVYGHGGEQVREAFPDPDLSWAEQAEQKGTGHAVQQAVPHLKQGLDKVLVLYGDVPLTRPETLRGFINATDTELGLLTLTLDDPTGYGRIVRDASDLVASIVEHKDASAEQRQICEINTGIMLVGGNRIGPWLGRLSNNNAQGEYYLTDLIAMAVADGVEIKVSQPREAVEAEGVNDRRQLAAMERAIQSRFADQLLMAGVHLRDPRRFDLRGSLRHGRDVSIDVNVIIEGDVTLGDGVNIGANTIIRNATLADNVTVNEHCVIENAVVGVGARVGPFARLRPGAVLEENTHVGNFVEIKNGHLHAGAKANHLSYIGDAEIGERTNIGAGTITCNYDGANKHKTLVGRDVFVGSNTALVAPIMIENGATIGAGSTVTKRVPEHKLTLTRARQVTIDGWQRPQKKPKE